MDDKFIIALIVAGSTLAGVVVSSVVSYLLSAKTQRQKSFHAAADFLRHKINVLEGLKLDLIDFGSTKHSISDSKDEMTTKVARALEETFDICSNILEKGGHFLPSIKRDKLLSLKRKINTTIAYARAEYHGLKNHRADTKVNHNTIDDMYAFIDDLKQLIDEQLEHSVIKIQKIYQLED
jgi:hypothetical protein